ncbi:MAG: hypothetical protein MUO26_03925 [Methanotrichaceae archaeon]|nr:hypothetical protein [Methanotrichaceae archaeon]
MGLKFKPIVLLLAAFALTTTVIAIDYLRGTTEWNIAEINGVTVESFEKSFGYVMGDLNYQDYWIFKSYDANANAGTVQGMQGNRNLAFWSGIWREEECNTIYCEMTSGGDDSWYLTFVNPKYFIAYKKQDGYYPLYRLGKAIGEPY